jgi:hypothetical protein
VLWLTPGQTGFMKVLGKLLVGGRLQFLPAALIAFGAGILARGDSSVTLEWDPNPDTNVVGYVLYNGVVGANQLRANDVGLQTSATLSELLSGVTNLFFVTAYDTNGIEGEPSNLIASNLPGTYPPPTVSAIADQFIGTNSSAGPVSFTITDALFSTMSVNLSALSSNPALVPNSNILLGGSDSNRSVTVVPARDEVGSALITVTVDDGIASGSTSFLVTVDPVVASPRFYIPMEAESGTLLAPMAASIDPAASHGQSVSATSLGLGFVTFIVDIPVSGACVAWWRVLVLRETAYPFIVAVDGSAADIFRDSGAAGTDGWHWSRVSGSARFAISNLDGSLPDQTVLPLTAGLHELTVWGLDPNMVLDEILLTNDRNFVPRPPLLIVPQDQTLDELTPLVVTNMAALSDPSASLLTFSLSAAPAGVVLDPVTGVLTWTPSEAQGPSTNFIGVQVTDDALPPNREIRSFKVVVNEVNNPPVLTVPPTLTIDEFTSLVVVNTFSDPDLPVITPTFSLVSAPDGMDINPSTGVLAWTPTETQGPSTNLITVQVTDNGSPPFIDTKSFTIVVNEVNSAPVIAVPSYKAIHGPATLVATNFATDSDLPANILTFTLVAAPDGVTLDPNGGVLTWTPTELQHPGTNLITVMVTDNGSPPLSDTGSFSVAVNDENGPPVLSAPLDQKINELSTLVVTNAADDPDVPANTLTFSLVSGPTGVNLDPVTGVLTWTPSEAQGPSTNVIWVEVTDNETPPLSDIRSFTVVVNELNSAPTLIVPGPQVIDELSTLVATNTAYDADVPTNTLAFSLVMAPSGVSITPVTGVLTWTPTELQGPSTNVIIVQVTDDGTPPLSATNSFTVTVNEVNTAPALPAQADRTINELTTLTVTNTATDEDLPANVLTYQLVSAPTGASIDSKGVITWTPSEAQGPGTDTLRTIVTDDGTPSLSATNSFTVTVNEVNSPPLLAPVQDQLAFAGFELTFTNTATDQDIPPNVLVFSLDDGAPAGAVINGSSGVFTWTPPRNPAPVTNGMTVRVTDNGVPNLSDTRRFNVIVVPPPGIESIVATKEIITITWSAIPGRTYRVQFKSDLNESAWNDLAGDVLATDSTAQKTDLIRPSAGVYYRVIVLP